MWARPSEDEGAQSLGGIGASIIFESIKESHKDSFIDVKRRLRKATMCTRPTTEFSQDRPSFSGGWRDHRQWKLALQSEESDENRGGRHLLLIGSAGVWNALLFLDCCLACFEPRQEVPCGKPGDPHPIRPGGQGGEPVVDGGRLVPLEMKPVGKSVNVISGGAGAESPSSNSLPGADLS